MVAHSIFRLIKKAQEEKRSFELRLLLFLFFSYFALKDLPSFGHPTMRVADYYIAQGMKNTGATNQVGSVILDFRAYDTLGEATVLFTAVIGVLTVLRKIGRKK